MQALNRTSLAVERLNGGQLWDVGHDGEKRKEGKQSESEKVDGG
jgi:hypothetical protein